jgi:hypothetical protein
MLYPGKFQFPSNDADSLALSILLEAFHLFRGVMVDSASYLHTKYVIVKLAMTHRAKQRQIGFGGSPYSGSYTLYHSKIVGQARMYIKKSL